MFTLTVVVSVLLVVVALSSAALWIRRAAPVVAVAERVGLPVTWTPWLGGVKIVGALGVIIGLVVGWLGVMACAGLSMYFALAVLSHIRVRDYAGLGNPSLPLVLALAGLVLRTATL
jgi:hypothetical protein